MANITDDTSLDALRVCALTSTNTMTEEAFEHAIERIRKQVRAELPTRKAEELSQADRHEMIDAAVKVIEPNVTNETHAWNVWSNLASNPTFVRAIVAFHGYEHPNLVSFEPISLDPDELRAAGERLRAFLLGTDAEAGLLGLDLAIDLATLQALKAQALASADG